LALELLLDEVMAFFLDRLFLALQEFWIWNANKLL